MSKKIYVVELLDENNNTKRTLTVNFNYSFFKNLFKKKISMVICFLNYQGCSFSGYKKFYLHNQPKRKVVLIPGTF